MWYCNTQEEEREMITPAAYLTLKLPSNTQVPPKTRRDPPGGSMQ